MPSCRVGRTRRLIQCFVVVVVVATSCTLVTATHTHDASDGIGARVQRRQQTSGGAVAQTQSKAAAVPAPKKKKRGGFWGKVGKIGGAIVGALAGGGGGGGNSAPKGSASGSTKKNPLPCAAENLGFTNMAAGKKVLTATVGWYVNATADVFTQVAAAQTVREKAKYAMKLRRQIRLNTRECLKRLGYETKVQVYLLAYSETRIFKTSQDFEGPSFDYIVSKYMKRNPNRAPTHQYLDRAYKDILGSAAEAKSIHHPWLCSTRRHKCTLRITMMEQV